MTRLDGAVETSVQLGVADVIADVVETGSTLRNAGLEVFGEPILESEAVLITRAGAEPPAGFEVFRRRLEGVLVARSYVMMDYDIRAEQVEEAVALTPGIESPTVSPLHREGWVAVRSMVPRATRRSGSWTSSGTSARAASSRRTSMPADSDLDAAADLPAARRADRRSTSLGALLVLVVVVTWLAFPPEIRDQFTCFQRVTVIGLGLMFYAGGYALARSRLVARADGLTVVNGYRTRALEWNQMVAVTLRPGSPWAVLDISDGTTVPAMGIQGSDGARAPAPGPARCAAARCEPAAPGAH